MFLLLPFNKVLEQLIQYNDWVLQAARRRDLCLVCGTGRDFSLLGSMQTVPGGKLGLLSSTNFRVHSSQAKQTQHEADQSPKVKKAWSNTSALPYCLHGMMRCTG